MWSCREKIPLSKNLKIFHLTQKLREEEYFKVINSDPYREKCQQKKPKSKKNVKKTSQTDGHPLKTASLMKILNLPLASLASG